MTSESYQSGELPEGIHSLLDTDLYKLTMQCCVLKYFPETNVTYAFTNRTSHLKLSRAAVFWLDEQIQNLADLALTKEEKDFLRSKCTYFPDQYLEYLESFRFRPKEQIKQSFSIDNDTGLEDDTGTLSLEIHGKWLETILYEIPLLALISEAYFRFVDRDWSHDRQLERALEKGQALCKSGCNFSEFGSRRRRDYRTHDTVVRGLKQADDEARKNDWPGRLTGTSNVHFAMKYDLQPIGTVAHEFFMAVAALTDDYEGANEKALQYWTGTFGPGVLAIALTDTFGTPNFLAAFNKPSRSAPEAAATGSEVSDPADNGKFENSQTFAQVFTGVRQDSGDPDIFIETMRDFYDSVGIKDKKTIVFSDALDVEKCQKYKRDAESAGFRPSFGVGTFLTNDFVHLSSGKKSVPLNIVIKLSSAEGRPAVKISDNAGKNTGNKEKVDEVKRRLGYAEKSWKGGDEAVRWGKEGE